MAIWQFQLIIIPKKGVLKKIGYIPENLKINHEERTEYYHLNKEKLIEEDDKFIDALTQDWWSSSEIKPMEIIHQIDKNVKRANYRSDYSIYWKFYSLEVDNDASMSINAETGKIEKITFRADLREKGLTFLRRMIKMAHDYEWLLMDMKGNLVNPEMKEIGRLIKSSNSYKFLTEPRRFLTDLENGKIFIE